VQVKVQGMVQVAVQIMRESECITLWQKKRIPHARRSMLGYKRATGRWQCRVHTYMSVTIELDIRYIVRSGRLTDRADNDPLSAHDRGRGGQRARQRCLHVSYIGA